MCVQNATQMNGFNSRVPVTSGSIVLYFAGCALRMKCHDVDSLTLITPALTLIKHSMYIIFAEHLLYLSTVLR